MTATTRRRTLVAAVVLVAAACTTVSNPGGTNTTSTGDGTSLLGTSTTATSLARTPTTADAGTSSTAPVSSASTMPEEISEFQQALLEDGVTFDEYETAVLAAAACIQERGFEVYGPYRDDQLPGGRKLYAPGYDPSLGYSLGVTYPATAGDEFQDAADAAYDDCVAEYLDFVDAAWSDVVAPTEEDLDRFYADLVACLRDQGFTIDDPWTRSDIDGLFGLPGFDACY